MTLLRHTKARAGLRGHGGKAGLQGLPQSSDVFYSVHFKKPYSEKSVPGTHTAKNLRLRGVLKRVTLQNGKVAPRSPAHCPLITTPAHRRASAFRTRDSRQKGISRDHQACRRDAGSRPRRERGSPCTARPLLGARPDAGPSSKRPSPPSRSASHLA